MDGADYLTNPCALFTDEQAKVLGFLEPGDNHLTAEVSTCFRQKGTGFQDSDLTITYHPLDLLGDIYRRETTKWPSNSMRPITIGRQPALITTNSGPQLCRIAIGLNDSEGVEVRVDDQHTDSCAQATQVAETIVRNLEG